jgi:hypothetical protein
VTSATLALTVGSSSSDGASKGGDLRTTADANWSEASVTWANAPPAVGSVVASLGSVNPGITYTMVVTPVVTGDGPLGFRLSSTSSNGARYYSKEGSSTLLPKLTVTCA